MCSVEGAWCVARNAYCELFVYVRYLLFEQVALHLELLIALLQRVQPMLEVLDVCLTEGMDNRAIEHTPAM